MRAQLTREFSNLRSVADEQARVLEDIAARDSRADAALERVNQIITSLTKLSGEHATLEAEHSKLANQVIELAAQLREEDREIKSQQDQEINRRLSELAAALRDEQRVCFRQVSLEASESAVLEDRARRALWQRLDELEAALKAQG
jgi:septal ring factor EnvC (AmiA/AmiB activator)